MEQIEQIEATDEWNRSPVKTLIAAVVLQALSDYRRYLVHRRLKDRRKREPAGHKSRRAKSDAIPYGEAHKWFHSPNERPFSFVWCCRQLDMDPDRARIRVVTGEAIFKRSPLKHFEELA